MDALMLAGRVAVVTGAAQGIGAAAATLLAVVGCRVLCTDVDDAGAEATAEAIREATGDSDRAVGREADVRSRTAITGVVDDAVTRWGRIDVMANIAGVMTNAVVADLDDETLDFAMAVNFKGTVFGCQAAAKHMTKAGRGSIVNISSAAIDVPSPGYGAYASSKAAVAMFTRVLAQEVAPHGVRANVIAPGYVSTRMAARHFTDADGRIDPELREQVLERTVKSYPLGVLADPQDLANMILYLVSDASRVVTGQILRPNAGLAMPW